ncbi:vacuolar protein sorting-associated protein 54-like [Planoprotostelium fungivorum]|uniref:Vacuolar protein sorting-associated protein 54 n=1 Tax=Planoprotostelium fungivorum TaxID=1890364 RepID=A0A2P6MXG2_9EUKA|nr:vacuolar protein sorting-associated protein 54-like [Planoprotostelium fungivorum]
MQSKGGSELRNSVDENKFEHFVLAQSLTSVLNDPKVSGPSKDWYTSSDMVVLPAGNLPHITLADFTPYIESVGKLYEVFESERNVEEKTEKKKKEKNTNRDTHDLSIIPEYYFRENFVLEDEPIFTVSTTTPEDDASPILLQEKLAHYLDVAEVELIKQISYRSESFFSALSDLQNLHSEVQKTCDKIEKLRRQLAELESSVIDKDRQVPKLFTQRNNLIILKKKLKLVHTVSRAQPTIQLLLANSDFAGALELIHSTQSVLQEELSGITSLKHMNLQLQELYRLIVKMLEAEFLSVSRDFFEPSYAVRLDLDIEVSDHEDSTTEDQEEVLIERITPLLLGVIRLGQFSTVFQKHKEEISYGIEETTQKILSSLINEENKNTTMGERLNQLSPGQFLRLSDILYNVMLGKLRRVVFIHDLFVRIFNACTRSGMTGGDKVEEMVRAVYPQYFGGKKQPGVSSEQCENYSSECRETTTSLSDMIQTSVSQVLKLRGEGQARLGLSDFVTFYNSTTAFVVECEKLGKKQSQSVRAALHLHSKNFVENFHGKKISSLVLTLENEMWQQVEVPSEYQSLADQLMSSQPSESTQASPKLNVGGYTVTMVNSGLMLIKMMSDYTSLLHSLPSLASDVIGKINDTLKVFNSRTCQLVLGAGAMHLQKLKSITAKHLALASEALTMVMIITPAVRSNLAARFTDKRHVILLNDTNRLLQDYSDHQKEISQKFVSILRERASFHLRNLKTIDWNNSSNLPNLPTDHSTALTKETGTLYRVLKSTIQEKQLKSVMSSVALAIEEKLREGLSFMSVQSTVGKTALYNDVKILTGALAPLFETNDIEATVNDVFRTHFRYIPEEAKRRDDMKKTQSRDILSARSSEDVQLRMTESNSSQRLETKTNDSTLERTKSQRDNREQLMEPAVAVTLPVEQTTQVQPIELPSHPLEVQNRPLEGQSHPLDRPLDGQGHPLEHPLQSHPLELSHPLG